MKRKFILRNRGLTWVEFLIVFAIIIITAAILVPNFIRAKTQGSNTACKSNMKNIGTALEMYTTDNDKQYPSSLSKLTANYQPYYLKVIPTCPPAGRDSYSVSYRVAGDFASFTFYCSGYNHKDQGLPPNYPQYNSVEGLVTP